MLERRNWIEAGLGAGFSLRRQCDLLSLPRSSFYYSPVPESALNLELMRLLDEQYLKAPCYGRNKHTQELRRAGYEVNPKRIGRLLKKMGIRALGISPSTTKSSAAAHKYPYLLKGLNINRRNQVWAADITWIPTAEGYLYLVAVIDWYSRYIISWALSNTLHSDFCLLALEQALNQGTPEIFNTDQGVQFTCGDFIKVLQGQEVSISMDGKGHYWDNIIIERLWRTLKYEEVYLKRYESGEEAHKELECYITFYNTERIHQSLAYKTPAEMYCQKVR